jgi:hypothetical protein
MNSRFARITAVLTLAAVTAGTLGAQPVVRARSALWVGAPLDDYLRLLQLSGAAPLASRLLRPLEYEARTLTISDSGSLARNPWRARYGAAEQGDTSRFAVELYHPIVRLTANSAVPFGTNDGSLWAGKGLSGAIDLGAAVRYGPLTVRLAPTATYSQNREFALGDLYQPPANISPYADPSMPSRIDMPQRFGDAPVRTLDWGQSSIQLNGRGMRAGVGTENMWWGPGVENALMMTNNARGFRHAFLGTERPVDVWIGRLEVLYTVGRLEQSDYWRTNMPDSATKRWLSALALVLEPRGAPGLYLGAVRGFYSYVPRDGIGFRDLGTVFQPFTKRSLVTPENPSGDDVRDQMLTVFGRWVFPASNAEVYLEFGRNDHSGTLRDALGSPDHSSAYVLGMQKLFPQGAGFLRLGLEATSLAGSPSQIVRPSPTWYTHHLVTQGYTERGQVIGAGIGPGGDAQSVRLDWYRQWGSVGGFLQRQRENSDAFYIRFDSPNLDAHRRYEVFLGAGVRGTAMVGPLELHATLLRQSERNRYMIELNDVGNLHLELGAQLRMR